MNIARRPTRAHPILPAPWGAGSDSPDARETVSTVWRVASRPSARLNASNYARTCSQRTPPTTITSCRKFSSVISIAGIVFLDIFVIVRGGAGTASQTIPPRCYRCCGSRYRRANATEDAVSRSDGRVARPEDCPEPVIKEGVGKRRIGRRKIRAGEFICWRDRRSWVIPHEQLGSPAVRDRGNPP